MSKKSVNIIGAGQCGTPGTLRDPKFALRKALAFELEKRLPRKETVRNDLAV